VLPASGSSEAEQDESVVLALHRSQRDRHVARSRRSRLTAADADFSKPRDEEEGDPA
jgi:hypothetical protein